MLGPLLGTVVGGFIALATNLYLSKKQREIQYALANKKQIYVPLLKELQQLRGKLDRCSFLHHIHTEPQFSAATLPREGELRMWRRIEEDERIMRVPEEFASRMRQFLALIGSYNEARKACVPLIHQHLEKLFSSEFNHRISIRNFGEVIADDLLAKNLTSAQSVFSQEYQRVIQANGTSLPMPLEQFSEEAYEILETPEIANLLKLQAELVNNTGDLEILLKRRIDYILTTYERKLPKV